jgi:hypothetical protein
MPIEAGRARTPRAPRFIAYLRVSTRAGRQRPRPRRARGGDPRGRQRRGWELVDVIRDAGRTGANLKRPGIRKALKAIANGKADGLVVAKLDRVSRSSTDTALLIDWFTNEARADFVALDVEFADTTSPMGQDDRRPHRHCSPSGNARRPRNAPAPRCARSRPRQGLRPGAVSDQTDLARQTDPETACAKMGMTLAGNLHYAERGRRAHAAGGKVATVKPADSPGLAATAEAQGPHRCRACPRSVGDGDPPRPCSCRAARPGETVERLIGLALSLAGAVDYKGGYRAHSQTVAELAHGIGEQLGIGRDALFRLTIAGLLHDVGKLQIPDRILLKPAAWTRPSTRRSSSTRCSGTRP